MDQSALGHGGGRSNDEALAEEESKPVIVDADGTPAIPVRAPPQLGSGCAAESIGAAIG